MNKVERYDFEEDTWDNMPDLLEGGGGQYLSTCFFKDGMGRSTIYVLNAKML
eukprot:CAMPEP_0170563660 /NCGR_PEP_ID=MMETSP0211-20121228/68032_1 /TAXON_ID=311385 /ORGANISM="Pseudokeronopsis sp., Strain OXSARD2" /LENGTH=51 /DNA_ID=CAMNT_0010882155 /DNA_START=480 /DNA_END=635 /DNA_ORIENTATION=+